LIALRPERLRDARKRAVLSQDDLAAQAEVSRKTISNYESGKTEPDLPTLRRLAAVVNVAPEWLTGGNDGDTVPNKGLPGGGPKQLGSITPTGATPDDVERSEGPALFWLRLPNGSTWSLRFTQVLAGPGMELETGSDLLGSAAAAPSSAGAASRRPATRKRAAAGA
jgi:transcriptional regulator with XRE-family HTH domain